MREIRGRRESRGRFACSEAGEEVEKSKAECCIESEEFPGIESVQLIMITMELLFGVQVNSEMVMPITLSGVNLKTKVETLKQEVAKKWNLSKDSLGKHFFCAAGRLVFIARLFVLFVT